MTKKKTIKTNIEINNKPEEIKNTDITPGFYLIEHNPEDLYLEPVEIIGVNENYICLINCNHEVEYLNRKVFNKLTVYKNNDVKDEKF